MSWARRASAAFAPIRLFGVRTVSNGYRFLPVSGSTPANTASRHAPDRNRLCPLMGHYIGRLHWQAPGDANQRPPERPLTWGFVERTTGFEPATLTLARCWELRPEALTTADTV